MSVSRLGCGCGVFYRRGRFLLRRSLLAVRELDSLSSPTWLTDCCIGRTKNKTWVSRELCTRQQAKAAQTQFRKVEQTSPDADEHSPKNAARLAAGGEMRSPSSADWRRKIAFCLRKSNDHQSYSSCSAFRRASCPSRYCCVRRCLHTPAVRVSSGCRDATSPPRPRRNRRVIQRSHPRLRARDSRPRQQAISIWARCGQPSSTTSSPRAQVASFCCG